MKICKKMLTAVLVCCLILGLAACGGSSTTTSTQAPAKEEAALSRYDYVADMKGNTVQMTIAQNLKSVKIEIASMKLDLTAYCTVEGNILTLTELAEGNEQFYKGLAATPYTLNEDGTAVPVNDGETASTGLSRYDFIADMNGNPTEFTIAQNLKSVKIGISSMKLEITAMCEIEGNILTITELAEGNEQFYKGVAAHTYVLNEDGTAVPQD